MRREDPLIVDRTGDEPTRSPGSPRGGPGSAPAPGPEPARLARLHPDCPTRPLDWRWRRAGLLLELGLRWSRRRDDEPTRQAKRYRTALRLLRDDDKGRLRLARRMPGIAGACAIRDGEPRARWAFEARLLAGDSTASAAGKAGLSPAAASWYEALFFHVSDRLGCRGYLVHQAIGIRPETGPTPGDHGALWRLFGLFGGPIALDALITASWEAAAVREDAPGDGPDAGFSPDPLGLAIAALTLTGGRKGPSGSRALLRLAASERRHAEAAGDSAAF